MMHFSRTDKLQRETPHHKRRGLWWGVVDIFPFGGEIKISLLRGWDDIARMLPWLRRKRDRAIRRAERWRGLRSSARCQKRRSSSPRKGAFSIWLWCLRMLLRLKRSSSGEMGTAISMWSISHSAHAPRYIQMRQSFIHSSSLHSSITARTASVQTR